VSLGLDNVTLTRETCRVRVGVYASVCVFATEPKSREHMVQAGGPGLSRAAFIKEALREPSVALCRGNASLCRSGAYVATRAAGRIQMRGLARPSAQVV
jgi:hypothetical protein